MLLSCWEFPRRNPTRPGWCDPSLSSQRIRFQAAMLRPSWRLRIIRWWRLGLAARAKVGRMWESGPRVGWTDIGPSRFRWPRERKPTVHAWPVTIRFCFNRVTGHCCCFSRLDRGRLPGGGCYEPATMAAGLGAMRVACRTASSGRSRTSRCNWPTEPFFAAAAVRGWIVLRPGKFTLSGRLIWGRRGNGSRCHSRRAARQQFSRACYNWEKSDCWRWAEPPREKYLPPVPTITAGLGRG